MFVTPKVVPRSNEGIPLATNQMRLRNLIQILGFSIKRDEKNCESLKGFNVFSEQRSYESYYYTLHSTTMSAPFYTSEKIRNDNPKWKELEMNSFPGNVSSSTDAFVIRLWSSREIIIGSEVEDEVISIWGVYLNGLAFLGSNIGSEIALKANSIVFLMPGGYFTDIKCLECNLNIRYISLAVNEGDIQHSYTVSTLTRLHTIQQVIRKELSEVDVLKQKISMGDFFRNETRGRTMLRRLLSKNKPRISHQDFMKMKESIEIARYRVHMLKEEKSILVSKLKGLNTRIQLLSDENQLMEAKIVENYRILMKNVQQQRELRRDYVSRRESQLHSKAKLNFRAQQLMSELDLIYPIAEKHPEKYTICGIHLPNSEDFAGHDEIQISVALGYVTHVIQMMSVFLQVPLRYPVIHFGSRSRIVDHITEKIPDSEREFPLFLRGKEKLQFRYGVYLLNKNIAQLRWLCGLPTFDLRYTLANLFALVKLKSDNSDLQQSNRSLSSSAADVSSLLMSSPVGSNSSNKKCIKRSEMSGSYTDAEAEMPSQSTFGHRISKSAGSAKDLMIGLHTKNKQHSQCSPSLSDGNGLSNSICYSLDKGLNEFKSSSTVTKPVSSIRSDSFLNSKVTKINTADFPKSKEKDRFLKSWEADNHSVPFSDDDCDINTSDFSGLQIATCKQETKKESKDKVIDQISMSYALETQEREIEIPNNASRCQVDVVQIKKTVVRNNSAPLDNEKLIYDRDLLHKSKRKQHEEEKHLTVTDSILENVTNRTAALANQSTTFNRFRSRLKGTLEN